jgi:NAD(P)-dependent dehydrogenase (short-subunit alcohol dehydrogenase family)
VFASARRIESIEGLRDEGCELLELDVADDESRRTAAAATGGVDVLVNNAGYSQSGAVETLALAAIRRQFETNVFGAIALTQLVLPHMRAQRWGRIVNVSSMGGRLTFPGAGAYHASKHALEAFSDALRFEVERFGVDVVVIEPGIVRTGFADRVLAELPRSDGPYAAFDAAVGATTAGAYESGPLALLGGDADDVARVIEKAVRARKPRTRYRVTPSASVMIGLRRTVPDRVWDRIVGGSYPRPQ